MYTSSSTTTLAPVYAPSSAATPLPPVYAPSRAATPLPPVYTSPTPAPVFIEDKTPVAEAQNKYQVFSYRNTYCTVVFIITS